ncbi:MAG: hypothetical protein DCC71_18125 [Proteobacteria bacterium]|nr:MAG: hypothetical protein DCC71_18125 [Pseudomonadota bacterium]
MASASSAAAARAGRMRTSWGARPADLGSAGEWPSRPWRWRAGFREPARPTPTCERRWREIGHDRRGRRRMDPSSDQLRLAYQARGFGIHDADLVTNTLTWDARARALWGVGADETITSDTFLDGIHPEDRALVQAALARARDPASDGAYRAEYRVIGRDDGVARWVLATGRVLFAGGRAVRIVGTVEDVTLRKQTEQELAQREQELRILTDSTPALISYIDADRRYRLMNRRYEEWFGQRREEALGREMAAVLGESAMEVLGPYVERALRGEEVHFETEAPYRSGGKRWIDAHYVPHRDAAGRVRGFFVLVLDVSARKRAERALRESDARLAAILEQLPVGVGVVGADGFVRVSNRLVRQYVGDRLPSRDPARTWQWVAFDAGGRPLDPSAWPVARALRGEDATTGLDFLFTDAHDGGQSWLRVAAAPFRDADGAPAGAIAVLQDVTASRAAEAEVRRLNEELRRQLREVQTLLDILPVGVWQSDPSCEHITGNREAYAMLGVPHGANVSLSSREARERGIGFRCFADGRELAPEDLPMQYAARTGLPVLNAELDIAYDDGRSQTLVCNVAPVLDADGRVAAVLAAYTDISERKAMEGRLRKKERRLRLAMEVAGMGGWEWNVETNEVIWSDELYRLFGVPLGTPISFEVYLSLLHPDDVAANLEAARDVLRTGAFELDYRVVRSDDGATRWFASRGRLMPDLGEGPVVIGVVTDVTRQREARERLEDALASLRASEERYRSLTESLTSVVWTTDPQGRFAGPQPTWSHYTGQSAEESAGDGWVQAIHPDDRERVRERWSEARRSGSRYESSGRWWHAASESYRRFEARAVAIHDADGEIREWVGTCLDVEDREQAHDALREADRRKDEFLATLAHELRNPLAPIRNAAQFLKLQPAADPKVRIASDMVERQVEHMSRLIDDLLDVSRITQGKLQLRRERVHLAEVVQNALDATRPHVERAGHKLGVSLPSESIELYADRVRLAQVLANLLDNACKYTEPGGRIWLTAERRGDDAVVSVRDTGIGIAAEHLAELFEMFTQVGPAAERSGGGLGIGLALVRGLVELHGGAIEARSAGPGRGSEFVVTLPLIAPPASATEADAPPRAAARGPQRSILVVDDNRDSAESMAMMLELGGHRVRTAHAGADALEAARAGRPDLVILDLGMPQMDGYEVCRRLRAEPWGRALRIVALTGWGNEEARRKTRDAGFDAHLVKPVDRAAVLATIGELLADA